MNLVFDQNIPKPLLKSFSGHKVAHAPDLGWGELENGALITAAEQAGYDVLVTSDQNIRYQQNLTRRDIGLVALSTNLWPVIRQNLSRVVADILQATRRCYIAVELPRPALLRSKPKTDQ